MVHVEGVINNVEASRPFLAEASLQAVAAETSVFAAEDPDEGFPPDQVLVLAAFAGLLLCCFGVLAGPCATLSSRASQARKRWRSATRKGAIYSRTVAMPLAEMD